MENKEITITMEEYKELLIVKGKYEELRSQQVLKQNYPLARDLTERYKLTCKEE